MKGDFRASAPHLLPLVEMSSHWTLARLYLSKRLEVLKWRMHFYLLLLEDEFSLVARGTTLDTGLTYIGPK